MRIGMKKSLRNGHDLTANWLKIKHTFADAATDVKKNAGSMVAHSVDKIKNQTARVQHDVSKYTASRPFKALGIAVLAGAVIGFLLRRRR